MTKNLGINDNKYFKIENSTLILAQKLNWIVQQFYEIEVTASYGKQKFSKIFILNVNVGEMRPPTDITMSHSTIEENKKIGTIIG